jgi:hypothetical protein
MSNLRVGEEDQPRGWMFGGSVLSTVAIGLVLAGMAIYYFRATPAPAHVVTEREREIHDAERTAGPPAPPPVEIKPTLRTTPPPPPPKIVPVSSVWDGVWVPRKSPLPMFELHQAGDSIVGRYAPNMSAVNLIQSGRIVGNSVEFIGTDKVFRAHFRMTMLKTDQAMVEECITDQDWLFGFANAQTAARTPQQKRWAWEIVNDQAKHRGKVINLGIFVRCTTD